jgi:hypothetical protein
MKSINTDLPYSNSELIPESMDLLEIQLDSLDVDWRIRKRQKAYTYAYAGHYFM